MGWNTGSETQIYHYCAVALMGNTIIYGLFSRVSVFRANISLYHILFTEHSEHTTNKTTYVHCHFVSYNCCFVTWINPHITPRGWLGSKHQLTNLLLEKGAYPEKSLVWYYHNKLAFLPIFYVFVSLLTDLCKWMTWQVPLSNHYELKTSCRTSFASLFLTHRPIAQYSRVVRMITEFSLSLCKYKTRD